MVLAIAALFLNLSPAVPAASGGLDLSTQAENIAPRSASPAANEPDRTTTSDSTNTAQFNLDKVALTNTSSSSSAPKLSAVSLENNENSQVLSTIRIPESKPGKPVEVTAAEKRPSYTRQWLALSLVQHGAAAFDAYSTRQAVSRGAVEDDPMMRPFAHSGAIYAAIQAGPVMLDFIGRRMQRSENGFIRKMWWMPQTISTAGFLFSGVHNLHVASRQ